MDNGREDASAQDMYNTDFFNGTVQCSLQSVLEVATCCLDTRFEAFAARFRRTFIALLLKPKQLGRSTQVFCLPLYLHVKRDEFA